MSSILDTSSLYNTYSQTASNAVYSTLQSSLGNVSDTSSDDQLLEACKSFESYFVQKVIESAKATIADEDDEEQGGFCEYVSSDGVRCRNHARPGSSFCGIHASEA